ncbi:transposase [Janthinobacterium sp. HLX7-2]|uniref:transposase n=1 Tax=Janthinobacterium sp. HLX7-2 TaxID=1259331 RepID=UPI003F209CE6
MWSTIKRIDGTLVLHTWAQNLLHHLHMYALVANGALGGDGHITAQSQHSSIW